MKACKPFFLLFSLLFLSACTGGGSAGKLTWHDIHQGAEAISITYLDNAPPDPMKTDYFFSIGTQLHNRGAYEIKQGEGYLQLTIESAYMNLVGDDARYQTEPYPFALKGKDQYDLKGSKITKMFRAKTISNAAMNLRQYDAGITVTACYRYQTEVMSDVCVDTDPNNEQVPVNVCHAQDLNLGDQGAPVGVDRVAVDMRPQGENSIEAILPEFVFYVENFGEGVPYTTELSAQGLCSNAKVSSQDMMRIMNHVSIRAELDGRALACEDAGIANLGEKEAVVQDDETVIQQKGTVICRMSEPLPAKRPSYPGVLKAVIDYVYVEPFDISVSLERR